MALRTVNYVDVLKATADLCGLDRENIATEDFRIIRASHDRRLQTAWEFDLWPELERTEKRYYRDIYAAATAYVATNEVYYPSSQKYYQALTSTTGNAPADSAGVTQTAFWADSATSYSPANYSNTTAYVRGNQVFYPVTDRSYQLYAASSTGNLPTDTSKWGVLTDFDPYVPYLQTGFTAIGNVLGVFSANPKTTTHSEEFDWFLSENGVQVITPSSWSWINHKIRTVRLTGEVWVSGTSYAVGNQVYYTDATTPGNFYDNIQATSSTAPTNTSFWSIVNVPLIFQRYLSTGGYADWLRSDGQGDKADDVEVMAANELANQSSLLVGQQQQRRRIKVESR